MEDIVEETITNYKDYVNPSLARLYKLMGLDSLEWEADGITVKDVEGQEYIDCLGGYGTFTLGHKPKAVIEAVKEQLDLMPLSSKVLFSQPLAQLAKRLAQITPGNLQYSFVCNSGTEAVEGALKLARLATERDQIIATTNSFHGKSLGALSATGREIFKSPFKPLVPQVEHVPFGDVKSLLELVSHDTAAIILEPIQGEGGIVLPPNDYLETVREICDSYGALMILDEVQTGLGRTGKLFACQHYNITPDIMTLAKALGGGVMPVGAFIATSKVWSKLADDPFLHTSTFGGNPLACQAALATIEQIEKEGLAARANKLGAYLLEELEQLSKRYSQFIKEVRGQGLMIGIELRNEGYSGMLISELIAQGVLVAYTLNQQQVIRLEPPLIIKRSELDTIIERLDKALQKVVLLAG
ncbi:acetylornithine/succinylornithine aminotransferase [Halobacteroides halobius DSM 5150]|uniref:Acetylornithine/succinylornithine aminotransferase n=1 Tax=Halobacteroides halobius (strain ATCC 35273 / DSM 5150 / MD-1) TaxID=748449 RepID=L0KAV2_HALHC|nr:acetylornithine/succinylornithine family transaminase [Halobacteroides halobius]AGB41499.1 acetylornithine/succinylornithine aminotransferase [Halobacteroides halobius DSM 5150]